MSPLQAKAAQQRITRTSSQNDSPTALSCSKPIKSCMTLLTDQRYFDAVAMLLLAGEAVLCMLIIRFVPYTEIDFSTYMQQVKLFLNGERDYSLIQGDTGPIVYPAGFLFVYSALYYVTDAGRNIRIAQCIFAGIYLATSALVLAVMRRTKSLPPWAMVLLCMSKRIHSLYVLRLFNDCIAMLLFYSAVFAWTAPRKSRTTWMTGTLLFSLALSIKMNLLLFLPGLLYLFFTSLGLLATVTHVFAIALTQVLLAGPFASSSVSLSTYFTNAFNFSREFLWEWTVNWRWVGQDAFESSELSGGLLIAHVVLLVALGFTWSAPEGGAFSIVRRGLKTPTKAPLPGQPTAEHICLVLFSSNLVGVLCSRSLHYQFYTWYFHQLPFLLWQSPFDLVQRLAIFAAIEFGWERFPSTQESSLGLTFANAFVLVGAFYADLLESGQARRRRVVATEGDRRDKTE